MYNYETNFSANSIPESSNPPLSSSSSSSCNQGHRSSLILKTEEGGCICLLCFTNLISNPNSPTFHVSYAFSQLIHAVSQPSFLSHLLSYHFHLILSPLVHSLSSFDDEQICRQVIDLVSDLSDVGGFSVSADFVARIADVLSSGEFCWSRRQFYLLHCLGVLLTRQTDTYACIKDKTVLVNNLVTGLQFPSEEMRGEIMFVLYKICILQYTSKDEEGADVLLEYCPVILQLSLDALMKIQRDDVRLNCLALLKVLGQRGFLARTFSSELNMDTCEADDYSQTSNGEANGSSMSRLFAEAIKSPLLSPDIQVQTSTLDLIVNCLTCGDCSLKQIQVLVEENLADYIFEILRLSDNKDQIVSSCVQVLNLLSTAEDTFTQRLSLGFSTLVSVLPGVVEVPFHPIQPQMLKLVLDGISTSPGVVSVKLVEAISSSLALMLKRYTTGEMGMLPETFSTICSILVALVKSPSASGASILMATVSEASRHAILASLSIIDLSSCQLLHSLSLLKEAYSFSQKISSTRSNSPEMQLKNSVIEICQNHILPWFTTEINGLEEESVLGILETLHIILSQAHDTQALQLTHALLSNSWFSLSFRCLGLYPSEIMRLRVYLMLSTIVDNLLGDDSGGPIQTVSSTLPTDPVDLLFLLGQKNNFELSSCQTAILQILYISSLYDEMVADKKLILTSLEQFMLANSSHLLFGSADSNVIIYLLNLYALCRSFTKINYQICYSPDAEKIFFQLLEERDWDLSSCNIHPSSLRWLFQQEKITKSLSSQILKLCRNSGSNGTLVDSSVLNFQDIALLASVGDNLLPKVLVLLLKQCVGEDMLLEDVMSLLHFISLVINAFPHASDQLCMHGVDNAIQNLCSNMLCSSSLENDMIVSRFIFIILCSVQSQTLYCDEAWLAVIMKLLDSFTLRMKTNGWKEEHLLVLGVLSLVLHHSTHGALVETAKFILLNSSLAPLMRATVDGLFVNGSASIEQEEETDTEQALVFILLFSHFYLRRKHGLAEFLLFTRKDVHTSFNWNPLPGYQQNGVNCSMGYLRSMVAILEGLVFHHDLRIAMNSGLCLSMIFSWEVPTSLVRNNSWCRTIVEELAKSLAAPCSVSTSFMNHHRPAVYITIALLRSKTVPPWMNSVLNEACVSGIIENLSPNNISVEVVLLFQQLLLSAYLKSDQIAKIDHLLQACRRCICMENNEDECIEENGRKVVTMSSDMGEVCEFLLEIMSSESHLDINTGGHHAKANRLMEETDLFSKLVAGNREV
ncbi:hypothetical protein BVRB_3g065300 isoform B [Beta vulgaris subsp. vulgaris]|uniref:Protein PRD1 n=1 Tax=Beta vulgaris subsp. vulgaris TaxID=3555 RepID=A0A0J8CM09_BETVV|nr:hypothetical protein BVRB_3g065300 isoform B [Beta vulgaris subsp. vulgaris]